MLKQHGRIGTAIETPMSVTVRLTVLKDKSFVKTPHFLTSSSSSSSEQEQYYCTTGVDPNIREATRAAVRNMILYLCAEHKMNRVDAYMLCSIAGDLRMHEVVDMPNYVVRMSYRETGWKTDGQPVLDWNDDATLCTQLGTLRPRSKCVSRTPSRSQ